MDRQGTLSGLPQGPPEWLKIDTEGEGVRLVDGARKVLVHASLRAGPGLWDWQAGDGVSLTEHLGEHVPLIEPVKGKPNQFYMTLEGQRRTIRVDARLRDSLVEMAYNVRSSQPGNSNSALTGHKSTGKNTAVYFLAGLMKQPVVTLSVHAQTTEKAFRTRTVVGLMAPGTTEELEGLYYRAARLGWWAVVDEANKVEDESVLTSLNAINQNRRDGKTVAAKTFRAFFLWNEGKLYGTHAMQRHASFLSRLSGVSFGYPSAEEETNRLMAAVFPDEDPTQEAHRVMRKIAEALAHVAQETRLHADSSAGRRDHVPPMDTRQLLRTFRHLRNFPKDIPHVRDVLNMDYPLEAIPEANREAFKKLLDGWFDQTILTAAGFKKTWTNISGGVVAIPPWQEKSVTPELLTKLPERERALAQQSGKVIVFGNPEVGEVVLAKGVLPLDRVSEPFLEDIPENQFLMWSLAKDYWQGVHFGVLGEKGSGKTKIILHFMEAALRRNLETPLQISASTRGTDILGQQGTRDGRSDFPKPPLQKAMEDGRPIFFNELTMAEDNVHAALHNVLEFGFATMTSGQVASAQPGFLVTFDGNLAEAHHGVSEFNAAFSSRFRLHYMRSLSQVGWLNLLKTKADHLAQVASSMGDTSFQTPTAEDLADLRDAFFVLLTAHKEPARSLKVPPDFRAFERLLEKMARYPIVRLKGMNQLLNEMVLNNPQQQEVVRERAGVSLDRIRARFAARFYCELQGLPEDLATALSATLAEIIRATKNNPDWPNDKIAALVADIRNNSGQFENAEATLEKLGLDKRPTFLSIIESLQIALSQYAARRFILGDSELEPLVNEVVARAHEGKGAEARKLLIHLLSVLQSRRGKGEAVPAGTPAVLSHLLTYSPTALGGDLLEKVLMDHWDESPFHAVVSQIYALKEAHQTLTDQSLKERIETFLTNQGWPVDVLDNTETIAQWESRHDLPPLSERQRPLAHLLGRIRVLADHPAALEADTSRLSDFLKSSPAVSSADTPKIRTISAVFGKRFLTAQKQILDEWLSHQPSGRILDLQVKIKEKKDEFAKLEERLSATEFRVNPHGLAIPHINDKLDLTRLSLGHWVVESRNGEWAFGTTGTNHRVAKIIESIEKVSGQDTDVQRVVVWDMEIGAIVNALPGKGLEAFVPSLGEVKILKTLGDPVLSADGQWVAQNLFLESIEVGGQREQGWWTVVREVRTGRAVCALPAPGLVSDDGGGFLAMSANGRRVARTLQRTTMVNGNERVVWETEVRDVQTGDLVRILPATGQTINVPGLGEKEVLMSGPIALSPNGDLISRRLAWNEEVNGVSTLASRTVVWDMETGTIVSALPEVDLGVEVPGRGEREIVSTGNLSMGDDSVVQEIHVREGDHSDGLTVVWNLEKQSIVKVLPSLGMTINVPGQGEEKVRFTYNPVWVPGGILEQLVVTDEHLYVVTRALSIDPIIEAHVEVLKTEIQSMEEEVQRLKKLEELTLALEEKKAQLEGLKDGELFAGEPILTVQGPGVRIPSAGDTIDVPGRGKMDILTSGRPRVHGRWATAKMSFADPSGRLIILWDLLTGKLIGSFPGTGESVLVPGEGMKSLSGADDLNLSYDGKWGAQLLQFDSEDAPWQAVVWDMEKKEIVRVLVKDGDDLGSGEVEISAPFLSRSGEFAVQVLKTEDGHTQILVTNTRTGEKKAVLAKDLELSFFYPNQEFDDDFLSISDDGARVVADLEVAPDDFRRKVIDVNSKSTVSTLPRDKDVVSIPGVEKNEFEGEWASLSPDGRWAVQHLTQNNFGNLEKIVLWNLEKGLIAKVLPSQDQTGTDVMPLIGEGYPVFAASGEIHQDIGEAKIHRLATWTFPGFGAKGNATELKTEIARLETEISLLRHGGTPSQLGSIPQVTRQRFAHFAAPLIGKLGLTFRQTLRAYKSLGASFYEEVFGVPGSREGAWAPKGFSFVPLAGTLLMNLAGVDPLTNFVLLVIGLTLMRVAFHLEHPQAMRGRPLLIINGLTVAGGSLAALAGSFSLSAVVGALVLNVVFHAVTNFIQDNRETRSRTSDEQAAHEMAYAILLAEKGETQLAARAINEIMAGTELRLEVGELGRWHGATPGFNEAFKRELSHFFPEGISPMKAQGLMQRIHFAARWETSVVLEKALNKNSAGDEKPLIAVAVDKTMEGRLADVVKAVKGNVPSGGSALFVVNASSGDRAADALVKKVRRLTEKVPGIQVVSQPSLFQGAGSDYRFSLKGLEALLKAESFSSLQVLTSEELTLDPAQVTDDRIRQAQFILIDRLLRSVPLKFDDLSTIGKLARQLVIQA